MLLEVHMLKNYPSTNLNRDDTGAPKTCVFGGVLRGRISSQCLKRSWRNFPYMKQELGNELGIRTRKMPELVRQRLEADGEYGEFLAAVQKKLTGIANKDGKESEDGKTSQIVFYSPADIQAITECIKTLIAESGTVKNFETIKNKELLKSLQDVGTRPISLDVALFGRMVTSDAFADVEAAMQVVHAVSTHRIRTESDFFTAMDDLLGSNMEDAGSAMMGETAYNSACYYEYANIDLDALRENLKYAAERDALIQKAIPVLLETMILSNPSGKQNSFAGNIVPDAVLIEIKDKKIPVNYVNAFVQPAAAHGLTDIVTDSIQKLKNYVQDVERGFGLESKKYWFSLHGEQREFPGATTCQSVAELNERIADIVKGE